MFRNILSIIAALTLAPTALDAQTPTARRVAITIDDCPVVNEMTDLGNFQRITNGLVGSFQIEKVPVTTFINERQLNVPGQRDRARRSSSNGSTPVSSWAITPIRTKAPVRFRSISFRTTS